MNKNTVKPPEKPNPATNPVSTDFIQSLQMLLENKELMFQILDLFPLPMEIFAQDGTAIFCNRIGLELNNIRDASLIAGKYNLLKDPVCNDIMGMREEIEKAFLHGEAVIRHDVILSIQDLVERGIIDEKPFEKAFMDWYLYPVKNGEEIVFVIFVCIVKNLYYGRPDLAKAKEYIDSHWLEEFDPKALAKYVNISVTQLYKIFKEHNNMTPGHYHKKCKVEHIREKLADKNLSIKQAFAACGEDSQGRIARIFKQMTGMSPREFRENIP